MDKALLTFADGSTLPLNAGTRIIPIAKVIDSDEVFASQKNSVELWEHIHDGLIPSICSVLVDCDFFTLLDDTSVVYNSNSIVSIKSI